MAVPTAVTTPDIAPPMATLCAAAKRLPTATFPILARRPAAYGAYMAWVKGAPQSSRDAPERVYSSCCTSNAGDNHYGGKQLQ